MTPKTKRAIDSPIDAAQAIDGLISAAIDAVEEWEDPEGEAQFAGNTFNARMLALKWKIEAAVKVIK